MRQRQNTIKMLLREANKRLVVPLNVHRHVNNPTASKTKNRAVSPVKVDGLVGSVEITKNGKQANVVNHVKKTAAVCRLTRSKAVGFYSCCSCIVNWVRKDSSVGI